MPQTSPTLLTGRILAKPRCRSGMFVVRLIRLLFFLPLCVRGIFVLSSAAASTGTRMSWTLHSGFEAALFVVTRLLKEGTWRWLTSAATRVFHGASKSDLSPCHGQRTRNLERKVEPPNLAAASQREISAAIACQRFRFTTAMTRALVGKP